MKNQLLTYALVCFSALTAVFAQSPVSGFMEGKGNSSTALSFNTEFYDHVFLVPNNVDGVPVFNDVTVNSVSFYNSYGATDNLDISLGLPYISTQGNASEGVLKELGYSNTRKGFQDISVYAKYRPYSTELGSGKLDFLITAGVKTPIGNYAADEGLQSIIAIGNRATSINGIAGAHFMTASGVFLTTQAGYAIRNGQVPNALIGEAKVGYAGSKFYGDLWLAGQTSDGGTNILGEGFNGFFPATDVSYHRIGLNLFVPLGGGFGIAGGASKYIAGRNVGESTGLSGSLVYQIR